MIRAGVVGRDRLRSERVVEGLQSLFLQVGIAEVLMDQADEPGAIIDFLDADGLTGQANAAINLFAIQAEATAVGDDDGFVAERIVRFADATVRSWRRRINLSGAFHI